MGRSHPIPAQRGKGTTQMTNNFGSLFRSAAADMANAIADTMGECISITPMVSLPNFPAGPDPARQTITVTGVYTHKPVLAFSDKRSQRTSGALDIDLAPLISTSSPRFCVRSCELPWPVRRQDRITLLRTGEVYEVTQAQPDSIGNMIDIDVVQLGKRYQFETSSASRFKGIR